MYDHPSIKEKPLGTLRMSTCVSSSRAFSGHLSSRQTVKKSVESQANLRPSGSSPTKYESNKLAKSSGNSSLEALDLLSRKVSDKSMLQRFQNADIGTAFMLATGDIFMKSTDVLRPSDSNDISNHPRKYTASETPFSDSLITSPQRPRLGLSNPLQDIAVTNGLPRTKHLVSTEISSLDSNDKVQYRAGLVRNYPCQTQKTNLARSLLLSQEGERPNNTCLPHQKAVVPSKYPHSLKNGTKLKYPNNKGYEKFKGSLRRPPSRNQHTSTVFGRTPANDLHERSRPVNLADFKTETDMRSFQLPKPSSTTTSFASNMLGVTKAIQQLHLAEQKALENDSMMKMKGAEITGVSYQHINTNSFKKEPYHGENLTVNSKAGIEESSEFYTGANFCEPDQSTTGTDMSPDDESDSVITQDTGVYEDDMDGCLEAEMHEDMGGSQGDFCPDDNDIDCVDDTAIGNLEDDDNLMENEEMSESARTSVIGDSHRDSIDDATMKPALIKSIFSNCAPVINFGTKHEKVEPLPAQARKLLKWKMSPITPIVVRSTVARSGFKPSKKNYDWIGYFGKHMKASGFRSLKEYQKINHFPGSFQLGRKDRLWRNLSRMQAKFGKKEFGFVPQSYILPWDRKLLKTAFEEGGSKQKYIMKPPASARGIGIKLIHKWNQIPTRKPVLVQKYLSKPLLLNGFKFDIRLYVYVSSFDPLRIYLFDDGLVRFATTKYSTSSKHLSNRYMHLTNYSINKHSGDFQQNDDVNVCQGHKWSLKALWGNLQERGVNTDKIWAQMKDIVVKTLISVEHFTNSLIKANCRRKSCCHELFGFDIMLDDRYHPWILEVNISPSLHSNSPLDVAIKGQMVADMFNIAGYQLPDKKLIMASPPAINSTGTTMVTSSTFSQDKRKESLEITCDTRAKHTYFARHCKQFTESELMTMMLDVLTVNDIQMLVETEDENSRRGHFERIFPGGGETRKYFNYFEQPRYYNALLFMWELKYATHRQKGNFILESFCRRGLHLLSSITSSSKTIPMEHVWTIARQSKIFSSPRTDPKYLPLVVKSSASLSALSSASSTLHVPHPTRISSASRWETSSTKLFGVASAGDAKLNSSRSTK